MKTRQLGKSGFNVGEVGLGCWQFGGDFGEMEESTAFAILEQAVESGVDFFDTANVYGMGRSEDLIGRFLKTCTSPVAVATKCGGEVAKHSYSEDALRRAVDASRERLGVESLDLLQLHCMPLEVLQRGEIFDWLRKVQDEGMIKHFGASVETVEEGLLCLEQEGLLSLQVIFNIFRQKIATDLLPQAKEKGVGTIVRLPLASGLLTGKFTKDTTFAETDHRSYNRDGQRFNVGETFAGLPFEKGIDLAEKVREVLPQGFSMVQLAMRWILDHELVSVVIPGASSSEQVAANVASSSLPSLPAKIQEQLAKIYQEDVHHQIRGPY